MSESAIISLPRGRVVRYHAVLTRIRPVGEKLEIACLHNGHDSAKQRQAHHDGEAKFRGERHLQLPEYRQRHERKHYIGDSCICADEVVVVVED